MATARFNPRFTPAAIRRATANGPIANTADTRRAGQTGARMARTARLRTTLAATPVQRMYRQFRRQAGMDGG